MNGKNVLGMILSNSYDECVPELTAMRTMGSVPFAGRYRLIDFALSNMVNSGVAKVGVLTDHNYHSLMDHVGSGRPWDLARKRDGLYLLPPFSVARGSGEWRMETMKNALAFAVDAGEEYILFTDSNIVCNIDYREIFDFHTAKNADITVACVRGVKPELPGIASYKADADGRITDAQIGAADGDTLCGVNVFLMRRSLFVQIMAEADSRNYESVEKDLILPGVSRYRAYAYEIKQYCRVISSLRSYFAVSMELFHSGYRAELFRTDRPVFTKLRDDAPTLYQPGCRVANSLIADGCVIEGTVENSIVFRGARIARNAVVRNSIIMQGGYVADGASVNCAILDKNVTVRPNRDLSGAENYPFFIGKAINV